MNQLGIRTHIDGVLESGTDSGRPAPRLRIVLEQPLAVLIDHPVDDLYPELTEGMGDGIDHVDRILIYPAAAHRHDRLLPSQHGFREIRREHAVHVLQYELELRRGHVEIDRSPKHQNIRRRNIVENGLHGSVDRRLHIVMAMEDEATAVVGRCLPQIAIHDHIGGQAHGTVQNRIDDRGGVAAFIGASDQSDYPCHQL